MIGSQIGSDDTIRQNQLQVDLSYTQLHADVVGMAGYKNNILLYIGYVYTEVQSSDPISKPT